MKNITLNYKAIILCIGILLSGLLLLCSGEQSIEIHVISIAILTLFSMYSVSFDIWHPLCWHSITMFLYTCSYSILCLLTENIQWGYSKELAVLTYVAFVTFTCVVGNKRVPVEEWNPQKESKEIYNTKPIRLIIVIIAAIVFLSSLLYLRGGFSSKMRYYGSGGFISFFAVRASLILAILYLNEELNYFNIKGRFDKLVGAVTGIALVLYGLILGDRDKAFIFLVITIYLLIYLKIIKQKTIYYLVPLLALLIPLSGKYRSFLSQGVVTSNVDISTWKGFLTGFFGSDFGSAGRNLMLILNKKDYANGYFHMVGILRSFLSTFFSVGEMHSTWFNNNIAGRDGYGFTMIGLGYVNGGYFGVIVVYILLGLIIKFLYKKSMKNEFWIPLYIYMIPNYIYANRSDLSLIFSAILVHAGLAFILVQIGKRVSIKGRK